MTDIAKRIKRFRLACAGLGLDPRGIGTFEDRLIIQKAFYLLSKVGLDLGVEYAFYRYGPYSRALTDLYYTSAQVPDEWLDLGGGTGLEEGELEAVRAVKGALSELGGPESLEFHASALYVLEDMYLPERDAKAVEGEMQRLKADLCRRFDPQGALSKLAELGLLGKERKRGKSKDKINIKKKERITTQTPRVLQPPPQHPEEDKDEGDGLHNPGQHQQWQDADESVGHSKDDPQNPPEPDQGVVPPERSAGLSGNSQEAEAVENQSGESGR
jgi:hypothetical protein